MKRNYLIALLLAAQFNNAYSQKLWSLTRSQASYASNNNNHFLVWGDNLEGQLGLGDCMVPTPVNTGTSQSSVLNHPFAAFSNILFASVGETYGAVITQDGKLFVMGWNPSRQLGYLASEELTNTENKIRSQAFNVANCEPSRILHPAGTTGWKQVAVGERYMVAIASDNQLYSWGRNVYGTLGRLSPTPGSTTTDPAVTAIPNPIGVTSWKHIFSGYNHVLAIAQNDRLYAWGHNYAGQLGTGTSTNSPDGLLYEVPLPAGAMGWKWANADGGQPNGGTDDLASEYLDFSLAITLEGKLYAWGGNEDQNDAITGKLGNTTVDRQLSPVEIPLPAGATSWVKVVAGGTHALGITNDGKLYSWGSGNAVGRGAGGPFAVGEVSMPTGVTAWLDVEAGLNHTLALGNNYKLYGFGSNAQSAIFNNANTPTNANAIITDLTPVPLAVNLVDFKAHAHHQGEVQLSWLTKGEKDHAYFEIEHTNSIQAANWKFLKRIEGAGNSETAINYSYTHTNPIIGNNYYRLKQVDFDGHSNYSNIISIALNEAASIKLFPNPATTEINMTLNASKPIQQFEVYISDILGNIVYEEKGVKTLYDTSTYKINITNLKPGVYFIEIKYLDYYEKLKFIKD
ncbi:T9SS type A sorting domain-containing protein [Pedobacter glucosidilyticus]|uniref:T9SS type A sorting domain-containing protein n=1 Tax=Pedobacter glucosidilyticus TaxID=1122941 RepID=UPI0003FEAC9D|nr:T9SS type A sorting domain-containing protein [Pedobacter glucosidilyticus]